MWKVNIKLGWCFSCKLQYYSSFHLAFSRSANQKVINNNGGIRGTSPIYSSYRSVIVSGWINSKASLTRRTFGFIFGTASWILWPAFSSLSSDFKALNWAIGRPRIWSPVQRLPLKSTRAAPVSESLLCLCKQPPAPYLIKVLAFKDPKIWKGQSKRNHKFTYF